MSSGVVPPPHGAPQFEPPPSSFRPATTPAAPAPALWSPVPVAQPYPSQPQQPPYPQQAQRPPQHGPAAPAPGALPQRPAVIALGCTLAVVASLQWVCALSLFWVAAAVGTSTFDEVGDNGALFHILNRFDDRMADGLAVPLYLFPLASLTTGFLVLSRRPWTRLVHTIVGLAALLWGLWWLQGELLWWFSGAWYVVVACLVLWTPAASAWYRWRPDDRDSSRTPDRVRLPG